MIESRVPGHDYARELAPATGQPHAFTARAGFTGCVWCGEVEEHPWHIAQATGSLGGLAPRHKPLTDGDCAGDVPRRPFGSGLGPHPMESQ